MAERSKIKIGATPGRLVLVATLAILFIVVLLLPSDEPQPPPEKPGARTPKSAQPLAAETIMAQAPAANSKRQRPWPAVTRQQAMKYDPFAASPRLIAQLELAAVQAEAAQPQQGPDRQVQIRERELARQEILAEMRTTGVGMLFQNQNGSVAMIGSRVVRIGDVVEGFRVVAIGRDGVVLEPANLNEPTEPQTPPTRK